MTPLSRTAQIDDALRLMREALSNLDEVNA